MVLGKIFARGRIVICDISDDIDGVFDGNNLVFSESGVARNDALLAVVERVFFIVVFQESRDGRFLSYASNFEKTLVFDVALIILNFIPKWIIGGVDTSRARNPWHIFCLANRGNKLGDVTDEREVSDNGGWLLDEDVSGRCVGDAERGDTLVENGGGFTKVRLWVDDFLTGRRFAFKGVRVDFENLGFDFGGRHVDG